MCLDQHHDAQLAHGHINGASKGNSATQWEQQPLRALLQAVQFAVSAPGGDC
jgi:hypothetical protein